jgi:hypothetical protein
LKLKIKKNQYFPSFILKILKQVEKSVEIENKDKNIRKFEAVLDLKVENKKR